MVFWNGVGISVTKKTVSTYKKFLDKSGKSPRARYDAIIKDFAMFNFAMKQRDYIAKMICSPS